MRPLREIVKEFFQDWAKYLPQPDASRIDASNLAAKEYFDGTLKLKDEDRADVLAKAKGASTYAELAESDSSWIKATRDNLEADGVSEATLHIFDELSDAKWPTNALATMAFWVVYSGGKMASVGKVVGAEGAYEMARALTPARPDPSMGWRMFFTSDISREKIESALKDAGWDDEYIGALEKAHRRYTEAGDALALLRRGEIDQAGFFDRLAQNGFDSQAMVDLATLKDVIPGPTDLVRMALREAFRDDVAAQWSYDEDMPPEFTTWMQKQGYKPEWAQKYWRAHWALPSTLQGFEMRHRDVIDDGELETLLRISDIPRKWRENLTKIAYRPLTRVDVRRMHDMGVLSDDEVKRSYKDLGYDDQNAQRMLDFTIAYNARTGSSELTEYKDLTRSVIVQAYKKGVISQDQAETRLMEIGYEMEGIGILLSLADWQQDVEDAPDYMAEYSKDIRAIVEKAYSQRVLSNAEAKETLIGVGYSETESTYLLTAVDFWWGMDQSAEVLKTIGDAYVKRGINRADALDSLGRFGISSDSMQQKMSEWDIQRDMRSRRLTESQYRKALQSEIISMSEYMENLRGLGYTEYDIWILATMAGGAEAAGAAPTRRPLAQT